MSWSGPGSYDRFLDIHLCGIDNYDFIHDIHKQVDYQRKKLDETRSKSPISYAVNKGRPKVNVEIPGLDKWKRDSNLGMFATRKGCTALIDGLLSSYHKETNHDAKLAIVKDISTQTVIFLEGASAHGSEKGRVKAYLDLNLKCDSYLRESESGMINTIFPEIHDRFIPSKDEIAVADKDLENNKNGFKAKQIARYTSDADLLKLQEKYKPNGFEDYCSKLYTEHNEAQDFISISEYEVTKKDPSDFSSLKDGYMPIIVNMSDVVHGKVNPVYQEVFKWVSEPGKIGKIRFNSHGDGAGNLAMQDRGGDRDAWTNEALKVDFINPMDIKPEVTNNSPREGKLLKCTADQLVSWIIGNGFLKEYTSLDSFDSIMYSGHIENTRANARVMAGVVESYISTISLAACMVGRDKSLTKNISTHTAQYALAFDGSLINNLYSSLSKEKLPPIKITGAQEVVISDKDQGMGRSLNFSFYEDNPLKPKPENYDVPLSLFGNIVPYTQKMNLKLKYTSKIDFISSPSSNYLRFRLGKDLWRWNKNFGLLESEHVYLGRDFSRRTAQHKITIDTNTYHIEECADTKRGALNYIDVYPPHGFNFMEDGDLIYILSPGKLTFTSGWKAFLRLAHSNSKIQMITKDNRANDIIPDAGKGVPNVKNNRFAIR